MTKAWFFELWHIPHLQTAVQVPPPQRGFSRRPVLRCFLQELSQTTLFTSFLVFIKTSDDLLVLYFFSLRGFAEFLTLSWLEVEVIYY